MSFRSPLARPNAQESEEDLLKLEQKFQQQKLRSSGLEPDEMGQGEDEDDCNWDTLDRLQHRMLDSSKAAAVAVRTANPPQILKAKSIASSSFGRAGGQAEKIRPAAASTAGAGLGSVRFQEPVVDVPTSAGLQQPSQSSKKKSIFALRKEAAAVAAASVQQQSTTSSPASSVNNNNNDPSSHRPRNPAPRVFESADHGLGLVLKEVVEKNLNVSSARSPTTQFQDVLTTGFPDVKVRGEFLF